MKLFTFNPNITGRPRDGGKEAKLEQSRGQKSRGQSLTEMALLIPVLVLLLSVLIEGGFALNGWIRVNTAARDAVRFAMDAGRPDQTAALVQSKLAGIEFGSSSTYTLSTNIDVYVITGKTDANGNITSGNWTVTQVMTGTNSTGTPKVSRTAIQQRLNSQNSRDPQASRNVPFTIVEVDFRYQPLLATIVARGSNIPMSSYAIVQQYPN